jgi:hypothetical protein
MGFARIVGGAAVAAVLATGAMAQGAPSPEKVALARQLVDASGGADQMKAMVQSLFRSIGSQLDATTPPEQRRFAAVITQKMQDRMIAATPQMIDATVQVYAENLTEKELRDYVAWQRSETGQSVKDKLPQIAADSLRVLAPVITQITQGIKQDVVDEACAQAKCTAHDKEVLTALMAKAIPKQGG